MKVTMMVVALAAALAAPGALAQSQEHGSQSGATEPPGGAYRGYFDSRDIPQEQTAQVPDESQEQRPAPGTLRKFNSNSGYGPEVQFDVDRREAAKRAEQQKQMR